MDPRLALLDALARFGAGSSPEGVTETFLRFVRGQPRALDRRRPGGHVTASAWVVDPRAEKAALVFHPKLERWLQPGGHLEPGEGTPEGSLREAREETGLATLRLAAVDIYDLDRHRIPARGADPEHWHYDVRHLVWGCAEEVPRPTEEIRRVEWVPLHRLAEWSDAPSVTRLAGGWEALAVGSPEIP